MLTDRGLAAIERVTPPTLRRTFVSLALAASGNDIRWAMAQVGHADHKMTYGVYAQMQRNLPRDYGHRVDEIIGGSLWHQQPQRRAGNGQLSFGEG
jgi:integrase